jgi:hypothetical protein
VLPEVTVDAQTAAIRLAAIMTPPQATAAGTIMAVGMPAAVGMMAAVGAMMAAGMIVAHAIPAATMAASSKPNTPARLRFRLGQGIEA